MTVSPPVPARRLPAVRRPRAWLVPAVLAAFLVASAAGAAAQTCPGTPGNAFAFLRTSSGSPPCPTDPFVRWFDPEVTFDCRFFEEPGRMIACGLDPAGCAAICRDAARDWSERLPGRFRFVAPPNPSPVAFCTAGMFDQSCSNCDRRVSVGGGTTSCDGAAFNGSVLAVTLRINSTVTGELLDADITVNQGFNSFFDPQSFRATVAHELGHVIGLDHPDQCGLNFNVLMRSTIQMPSSNPCFVSAPTGDDVNGAQRIYPVTLPACGDPDNDGVVDEGDAVEILLAAAALPSLCMPSTCDRTGDGVIDDVDGVHALRAAAGLSSLSACP